MAFGDARAKETIRRLELDLAFERGRHAKAVADLQRARDAHRLDRIQWERDVSETARLRKRIAAAKAVLGGE